MHVWSLEGLTMLPVDMSFIPQECLWYLQSRQYLVSRTRSEAVRTLPQPPHLWVLDTRRLWTAAALGWNAVS